MNCTILGLKIANVRAGTEETATDALQMLIDKAFAAAGRDLKSELASIGPTGAILLAQKNQANAHAALRLTEAIVAQSKEPGYAGAKWPVAGVITQGHVREVNVFGKSWNFEGRPAISAARILAKLESGLLAVEADVVCPTQDDRALGKKTSIINGKRKGEKYRVRIHPDLGFNRTYEPPPRARQRPSKNVRKVHESAKTTVAPPILPQALTTPICQRLRIEAFSDLGLPPRVQETHELQIPATVTEFTIPIALCAPLGKPTAADVRIDGPLLVFDGSGLLETKILSPSPPGWRIRIIVPSGKNCTSLQRVVHIVYRPVPLGDRIFIRMPASGYQIQHALVVLWGAREQLELGTSALTIRTGDNGGRHPIVAACFELATNPRARAWDIERFKSGFDHEISWVDTWKPT
jgi:hypothetical protein